MKAYLKSLKQRTVVRVHEIWWPLWVYCVTCMSIGVSGYTLGMYHLGIPTWVSVPCLIVGILTMDAWATAGLWYYQQE